MSRSETYLITGASRGVGRQTAIALSQSGHRVILTSRNSSALQETADLCTSPSEQIVADLSTSDGIHIIKTALTASRDHLDGIVHNAGRLINKPFRELTDNDWNDQIAVNLLAPARLTRELIPILNNPSHIVMIGSMGGFQGSSKFPGLSAYSATKAGVVSLAECLAVECSDLGICVNALCLGAVQTDMLEEAFPGMNAPVSAPQMGRYIAHFLTLGAQFYNGKVLPVALSDPN